MQLEIELIHSNVSAEEAKNVTPLFAAVPLRKTNLLENFSRLFSRWQLGRAKGRNDHETKRSIEGGKG